LATSGVPALGASRAISIMGKALASVTGNGAGRLTYHIKATQCSKQAKTVTNATAVARFQVMRLGKIPLMGKGEYSRWAGSTKKTVTLGCLVRLMFSLIRQPGRTNRRFVSAYLPCSAGWPTIGFPNIQNGSGNTGCLEIYLVLASH